MHRTRSLTGLLAAPTLGVLSLGLALGLASPAAAAPDPKIWGVVVDGKGQPILGVQVTATGDSLASDSSYEGGPDAQVGYFELNVARNGTYTVRLAKDGYETDKVTSVEIGRGSRVVGLGEIELERSTSVSGRITSSKVFVGDRPKARVAVDHTGKGAPTGTVEVTLGGKVLGTAKLKQSHDGVVSVTLDKQTRKGSFRLSATYLGDGVFAGTRSEKPFVLEVAKARIDSQRHRNALTYLG